MAHVMIGIIRQAVIALHLHLGGFAKVVHVHRRFAGRHGGLGFAASTFMRLGQQGRYGVHGIFITGRRSSFDVCLLGQFFHLELLFQRVRCIDHPPFVDRSCRANRYAIHAKIADVKIHHDVIIIMFDRADRAGHLAGIAADTDFRINEVLFDGLVHDDGSCGFMCGWVDHRPPILVLCAGCVQPTVRLRPCATLHIQSRPACCRSRPLAGRSSWRTDRAHSKVSSATGYSRHPLWSAAIRSGVFATHQRK